MKRCPDCHTLYDASLPVCPKCGVDEQAAEASCGRNAAPGELRRSRLLLLAAVPLFVLLIVWICGGIVRLAR